MIESKTVVVDQWRDLITPTQATFVRYPVQKFEELTMKQVFENVLEDLHSGDCYYFSDIELGVVEKFDKQLAQMLRAHKASEDAIDAYYESRVEGRHP